MAPNFAPLGRTRLLATLLRLSPLRTVFGAGDGAKSRGYRGIPQEPDAPAAEHDATGDLELEEDEAAVPLLALNTPAHTVPQSHRWPPRRDDSEAEAGAGDALQALSIDDNQLKGERRETPIPWRQLSLVLVLQLCEPLTSQVINPFVPQVRSLFTVIVEGGADTR